MYLCIPLAHVVISVMNLEVAECVSDNTSLALYSSGKIAGAPASVDFLKDGGRTCPAISSSGVPFNDIPLPSLAKSMSTLESLVVLPDVLMTGLNASGIITFSGSAGAL